MSHAKHRGKTRMDMDLCVRDIVYIRALIKKKVKGRVKFLKSCHNDNEIWNVDYRKKIWKVIYDPSKNWVVTILNPPSFNPIRKGKHEI